MRLDRFLRLNEAGDETLRTRLQECLHCVIYGIGKKKLNNDIWDMPEILQSSYDRSCSLDTPFGQLYEFAQKEPSWRESIIKSSNIFHNSAWSKGKYKYHRGDAFMNSIYAEFQRLAKTEGVKLNNDKWNPADIWASKPGIIIPTVDSVVEYNKWIFDSLKSGKLIGISLKKVTGSGKIVPQTPDELPEPQEYKNIKNPKGTMFATGITINLKSGYGINYRSFQRSKAVNIHGELVKPGSNARHGKVPGPVTTKIIKDYNIPQMSKQRIKSMSDEELQLAAIELWADCGHVFDTNKMEKDWVKRKADLDQQAKKKPLDRLGYWISLINSLELGAYVNKTSAANDIVNKMYQGAKSASVYSSSFVKIY
jgi:hypothetical protein